MDKPESPYISVVIPIYNEEENIPALIDELKSVFCPMPWSWEIVLVDDGSRDRSPQLLQEQAEQHQTIRPVFHGVNLGQSAAFRTGFQHARGTYVVTMDGDLQNDPTDIPKLVERADPDTAVCGYRAKRRDNFIRRFSSRVAYAVRNWVLRDGVIDTGCSLKAMPRDRLLEIPHFRGVHRFYPALLMSLGVRIEQLPVNHRPRVHGESKYGVWNRAFAAAMDMLGVYWLRKRALYKPRQS